MLQAIGTATCAPRAALMPAATWLQASALRLDTTTRAPCSARRSAIALPMPLVEPVTSATLPVRSKRVIAHLYQMQHHRDRAAAGRGQNVMRQARPPPPGRGVAMTL